MSNAEKIKYLASLLQEALEQIRINDDLTNHGLHIIEQKLGEIIDD